MTQFEIQIIRRAIETLRRRLRDDEPRACVSIPTRSPILRFAKEYLAHNAGADVSCSELWTFYREIADSGELPPMRKAVFLRQLPGVMESVFNVRKCHAIMRHGRRQRGFRGVGLRMDAGNSAVFELEPKPA